MTEKIRCDAFRFIMRSSDGIHVKCIILMHPNSLGRIVAGTSSSEGQEDESSTTDLIIELVRALKKDEMQE